VLIVGLSERTGFAAAGLLERHSVPYKISDCAAHAELEPLLRRLAIPDDEVFTGPQDPAQLEGISLVLLSPGVPRSIPLLVAARQRGIPIMVDVDFLYELIASKAIVAITGTDGKTTTTSLIGELLQSLGKVVVAGNIGVSLYAQYDEILACDWLVLELSSFMLEQLSRFRPDIAVILNIAPDHVDRYESFARYAAVKFTIVRHCREGDLLVKNIDDPLVAGFEPAGLQTRTISQRSTAADAYFDDGDFHVMGHRFAYADCLLAGSQNVDNILAAAMVAFEAGVQPARITQTVREFRGLRHRLQLVGRYRGVAVYDDSKASNVHAVEGALRNFHNVVLILGGRDKGLDFSGLRRHAHRIRRLVCYGEDGEKIRDVLGFDGALYQYRFEDAVRLAAQQCSAGDVLLLSPGCTSWDQFANYEVRGDVFQQLIPQCFA